LPVRIGDMHAIRFTLALPFLVAAVFFGLIFMFIVGDLTLRQYWNDLTLPFIKKPRGDWHGRP
jgi:hypothetical protein